VTKKVKNYLDLPRDMNDHWLWICAIDAYDYNDTAPLSKLIRESEQIPEMFRVVIAGIVQGERRPNKKAATKLKLPASERMKIAGSLSLVLGLIDAFKYQDLGGLADRQAKEPIDVMRELEADAREIMIKAANDLNVSVETIENVLRDLRKKIEDWPNV